jgi:hypothetical protein
MQIGDKRASGPSSPGEVADMSTITRESVRNALPQTGRGDAVFAGMALLVCLLALILKVSGVG